MNEEMKNGMLDEELEDECAEDFVVELTDEEGKTEKFTILDSITYKDEDYVVLATEEEPDSVVILKYVEEDGEEGSFVTVDDEETLQAVFDIFVDSLEDCGCGCDDCGHGCGCGCEDHE